MAERIKEKIEGTKIGNNNDVPKAIAEVNLKDEIESEQLGKKSGRPPGAKNKATRDREKTPRIRRKAPGAIRDTNAAINATIADLDILVKKHNDEHGTKFVSPIHPAQVIEARQPIDEKIIFSGLVAVNETIGMLLKVDERPSEEAVKACAVAWSELEQLLPPVSPVVVAVGGVVISTGIMISPMIVAKIKIEKDIDILGTESHHRDVDNEDTAIEAKKNEQAKI